MLKGVPLMWKYETKPSQGEQGSMHQRRVERLDMG